ncbi:DNA polymerase I [Nitrosospira lacus]|uniref:DNA polymerase I n=1 Tax=Nitrosospira lacus TaxID=1288494 RepID=A0A1W6SN06_9PROT|nr:DNA polymerase I [Nitrosospira lacus]ARO87175.1 DNA polymerase I [Nitrosospira lacus]
MKTLLLVDGSSYLYRAFHALPDLRNRNNEPTGAIYGVLNMLRRLHKDYQAHYSACVFDAKGKTFRDDLYAEYKSHRPPMPPDLAAQIAPLHECIIAMGWPMLIVEGVEADDVIGTLAKQAVHENMRCIISTGDKDIAQLVNPQVTLINTMSNETLDEAAVLAKFGVTPARMLDYLALVGDAVDNIPGVEKVGPKTAVKWLTQYGTLDNLIAHANEIGGVVGENLRAALAWLSRARELLAIKCDVALPVDVHDLGLQPQHTAKLAELYERLDFRTWLREMRQEADSASPQVIGDTPLAAGYQPVDANRRSSATSGDYQIILTQSQLDEWIARIYAAPLVSLDTETTGLDPMQSQLVGISFSIEPHQAAYLPLTHRYAGAPPQLPVDLVINKLKPWLEDAGKPKAGQNLKYDKHIFANHGITLNGIVHDTLLQSYVLESHRPHDMDNLALRHLGAKTISYDEVTGKGAGRIGFDQVDIERAMQYAAEDADITLQLHQHMYPEIMKDEKLDYIYRVLEMPVLNILFEMERNGVLLDLKLLEIQSRELGEKMLSLESQAHAIAGQPFNLNSPRQIQEILFNQLKLPVIKKTPSGTPSTDEDVLQQLALDYPLAKVLLEYRGLAKLKSTYTDKLPRMVDAATGRVHTNYAQAVAVTGRLASNEPNLQNIPVRTAEGRRIREAFIAAPGHRIISADYSQIELRIMAHISQDAGLLKAFAAGEDIHRATAAEVFGVALEAVNNEQRRYAKIINFGLIYGMSEFGLASQLGVERSAARAYMDRYFARYPGVANYMQHTRETARKTGYVETVFGRRLWLPEINSSNGNRRQGAERAAINAPMQGTAADIIKLAMIATHGWLAKAGLRSKLIMQVHDELVLEVPDDETGTVKDELPRLMGGAAKLDVPLLVEVGVGPNWEQAH